MFQQSLHAATSGGLQLPLQLVEDAQSMVQQLQASGAGLISGAQIFYEDLCSEGKTVNAVNSFCLYGAVNALFVAAAGFHSGISGLKTKPNQQQAQEYLMTANSLLGLQYCLDFQESSLWPIHSNDIIANINQTADAFHLAGGSPEAPASVVRPGSSLYPLPPSVLVGQLSVTLECSEVRLVAVGTHPTLTLEAVTMLRDFAFTSKHSVKLLHTFGITYKCAVFPDMCGGEGETSLDPIAALIGRFEAPPPYELYTLHVITERLAEVVAHLDFDLLVCTSPFIVCALMQYLSQKPLLGYLGLPLLWKRPTDHFDNRTARDNFWQLLTHLLARSDVVLASNNPILAEQIAFQAKGATDLPVVHPHARFTQAVYTPTRLNDALLVSRTKFLWVTFGCALRRFMGEAYPIKFTVANSDSKLSFREMAAHRAVVIIPWEHALMAFFEFYSMSIPLLMPDASWCYRLMFDAEGNLGSTLPLYWDVSPECDFQVGCNPTHPYPPFAFQTFQSRRYWYQYSSLAQFPHIQRFVSIPDLLDRLLQIDLAQISAAMKAFHQETLLRSAAFWRSAGRRLLPNAKAVLTTAMTSMP
eukprot:Skav213196  [mRNA]  locus=scaffold2826:292404:294158:+ [translate_table: standard]